MYILYESPLSVKSYIIIIIKYTLYTSEQQQAYVDKDHYLTKLEYYSMRVIWIGDDR